VREACEGLVARFDQVLSFGDGKSPRDKAAHRAPVEAASLLVVLRRDGVGIKLQDGGVGNLTEVTTPR
jgi:hypothetical protein